MSNPSEENMPSLSSNNMEEDKLNRPSDEQTNAQCRNQDKMRKDNPSPRKGSCTKNLYRMKLPIENTIKSIKKSNIRTSHCVRVNKKYNKMHLPNKNQDETDEENITEITEPFHAKSTTSLNDHLHQLISNEHYYYVSEDKVSNEGLNSNYINKHKKLDTLKKFISEKWKVAELKTSAYISASSCLSTLVPFPFFATSRNEVGRKELKLLNSSIPKVPEMDGFLGKSTGMYQHDAVVNILHWLLISMKNPVVVSVPEMRIKEILSKVGPQGTPFEDITPFLYKIMWHVASPIELEWETLTAHFPTKFALLGCPYEYLHSVMHYGFYPNLMLEGMYGRGLYMTTDLQTALKMCTFTGFKHNASKLSRRAVLVLEFCDHDFMRIQTYMSIDDIFKPKENICGIPVTWYYSLLHKSFRVRYIMLFFEKEEMKFKKMGEEITSSALVKKNTPKIVTRTLITAAASAVLINTAAFLYGSSYSLSDLGVSMLGKTFKSHS